MAHAIWNIKITMYLLPLRRFDSSLKCITGMFPPMRLQEDNIFGLFYDVIRLTRLSKKTRSFAHL